MMNDVLDLPIQNEQVICEPKGAADSFDLMLLSKIFNLMRMG